MNNKCIICRSGFDFNITKPEHILLNSLGGKKTTRKAICSNCNEKAGGTIDTKISQAFEFFRNHCNWKAGNGGEAPLLKGLFNVEGQKINLLAGGVADDRSVEFKVIEENGVKRLEGGVSSYERLVENIPNIAKMLEVSEERVFEELTKNGLEVNVKQPPAVKVQMQFGDLAQAASAGKMSFVLWCELLGNDQVQTSGYDKIASALETFINKKEDLSWKLFTNSVVPVGLNFPTGKDWGKFSTTLHAYSNNEGEVFGWLRVYNTINYFAELGKDELNKNRSITLFSNPETLEWDIVYDFNLGLFEDFFKTSKLVQEDLQIAVGKVIQYGYEKQLLNKQRKLSQELVEESIPTEDDIISSHHIEELSHRASTALVAHQLEKDYKKIIPKKLAQKKLKDLIDKRKKKK